MEKFTKDFSQPDPISDAAIQSMTTLLQTGRLHRYQGGVNHTSEAEEQFAQYVGAKYCLGLNSGGSAIFLALKTAGVTKDCPVLTNAYTLAPVPGAILHTGGKPVLVQCSQTNYQIDMDSLRRTQKTSGAQHLLLCYMRGRVPNLDQILEFCQETGVTLIEDCAHVLGSRWRGKHLGTFGTFGCFSTQTNKLINSGEGGFLVTNDEDLISKAILHSGSYGHFYQHRSRPSSVSALAESHGTCPNFSLRMTHMAALLVLDQIPHLAHKIQQFNRHYHILEEKLGSCPAIKFAGRLAEESIVGTSFQFNLITEDVNLLDSFYKSVNEAGVKLAWFGKQEWIGFTSTHKHWRYVEETPQDCTNFLLDSLFDLPLYHTATWMDQDFVNIANIITDLATSLIPTPKP